MNKADIKRSSAPQRRQKGRKEGKLILISYRFCIFPTSPSAALPPSPPLLWPIHNSYGHYMNCTESSSLDALIRPRVNPYPWVSPATCSREQPSRSCMSSGGESRLHCRRSYEIWMDLLFICLRFSIQYMDKSFCTQFKGIVHPKNNNFVIFVCTPFTLYVWAAETMSLPPEGMLCLSVQRGPLMRINTANKHGETVFISSFKRIQLLYVWAWLSVKAIILCSVMDYWKCSRMFTLRACPIMTLCRLKLWLLH